MINVTKPFLPPLEDYQKCIAEIWDRNWLTNNGPFVNELELRLKEYLDVEHLLFLTNGTIAIQLAIKALELSGEIITTPFSYVATTSSIVWENCSPVFVDIDPNSLNIDPNLIAAAITEKTTAILATHVYGNPCDIDAIERIAKQHDLKVIYDAAHCFGTQYKGQSVLNYGDICTISFHATKLFQTGEGGAIVVKDKDLAKKIGYLRNFGHSGPESFDGVGINGKNSEFHAAMGLCNLKYVEKILEKRKSDYLHYMNKLDLASLKQISLTAHSTWNYSYIPVLFESETACVRVFEELKAREIYARRYFYPTLNSLDYLQAKTTMPIAEDSAKRVLCLPSYFDLTTTEIDLVCRIINQFL